MDLHGVGSRIVLALFVSVTLLVGLQFAGPFPFGRPALPKMPRNLQTPAVLLGSDLLTRTVFLQRPSLGKVTDLRPEKEKLGIAGTKEAVWADLDGSVLSSVKFETPGVHVDFIDVEGDGTFEFLNRGGEGWQPASLLDQNGRVLWKHGDNRDPNHPAVDDMAGGDLDGDGIAEFVVGHNGGGGVRLLDRNGKSVWREPDGNVWHVELVDTDADGKPEIVHSNAGGQMTVRDRNGKVLRRADPGRPVSIFSFGGPYFSDFSICRWPTQKDQPHALLAEDDRIWLFDFTGKTVAEFEAPNSGSLGMARGTTVRLIPDEPEYLAVIVEFDNWGRSVLYVYGPEKTLVYQEVLDEVCTSIAAVSLDGKAESLLVGGEGKVWKYTAAD